MSPRRIAAALAAVLASIALSGAGAPPAPVATSVVAIRNGTFEREEFAWNPTGVQTALDFVKEGGGTVLLPVGQLRIERPLVVWDRTTLEGGGRETVIQLRGSVTSTVQALWVGSHCRIANLTLLGTGYAPHDRTPYNSKGVAAGLRGRGEMDSTTVEGCYLAGWNTTAIDLMGHSRGNIIRNNLISGSGWEGIYVAIYCDSNTISGNVITDCRRNAIDVVGSRNLVVGNTVRQVGKDSVGFPNDTFGILIYSRRDVTGLVTDNQVEKNIVEGCYDGIAVLSGSDSDNRNSIVIDNDVFANRRYGIRVGSGAGTKPYPRVVGTLVSGNQVRGNGADGIIVDRVSRCTTVAANHIFENGGSGVRVWSMPGLVDSTAIQRNDIHHNNRHGVEIDSLVTGTIVADNVVVGNALDPIIDQGVGSMVVRNRVGGAAGPSQPPPR